MTHRHWGCSVHGASLNRLKHNAQITYEAGVKGESQHQQIQYMDQVSCTGSLANRDIGQILEFWTDELDRGRSLSHNRLNNEWLVM